jgi:hypothetical protein
LKEDKRRGQKQPADEPHLKIEIEWFSWVEIDKAAAKAVVAQCLNNGLLH